MPTQDHDASASGPVPEATDEKRAEARARMRRKLAEARERYAADHAYSPADFRQTG
jgi:hypothetical protein